MTTREKSLAGAVGAMLGGFVVYGIVGSMLLTPAAEADRAVRRLQGTIDDHKTEIARKGYYDNRVGKFIGKTFGRDEDEVKRNVLAYVMRRARECRINTKDWDTSPKTGAMRRGVYKEVGLGVTAFGSMDGVTNFVRLLQDDSYLHRITLLNITPVRKKSDMKVQVRYFSLVLDPKVYPETRSTTAPASRPAELQLASLDPSISKAIVDRDMFRPYVKKPIVRRTRPTPTPKAKPAPPKPRPPAKAPIETRLKIVSLSQLGQEEPDVYVRHIDTGSMTLYKMGEKLLGGRIEMVDYRVMPHPDNPEINSTSRVIVSVGTTYWAVELGQTLSCKRRLGSADLPQSLRPAPVVVPPGKKVSTSGDKS